MDTSVITINQLSRRFNGTVAVNNLSLGAPVRAVRLAVGRAGDLVGQPQLPPRPVIRCLIEE